MPRVIITVPEKNPQPYRFQLGRMVVSLGRGSDNDIAIDSGSVSVKHAEMHRVEGGYELADLGSTNGIKYGGNREQRLVLRSGMSVKLGDVTFDFTLSDEEQEILERERPVTDFPVFREAEIAPSEVAPEPRAARRPTPPAAPASSGSGFGMILLFLVLAAVAFYVGMDIRHRKEVKEPLLKGIVNKGDVEKAAPKKDAKAKE